MAETSAPQTWKTSLRAAVFFFMAVALLLGLALQQVPAVPQYPEPDKARLLARGGDNMLRAYYLALDKGVNPETSLVFIVGAADFYFAAHEVPGSDFRHAMSAAICLNMLGRQEELPELLSTSPQTKLDRETQAVLSPFYMLMLSPRANPLALKVMQGYLEKMPAGRLLLQQSYKVAGDEKQSEAMTRAFVTEAQPLLRRTLAACGLCAAVTLFGLIGAVVWLLRRRRPRAEAPAEEAPTRSWGAREAIEAVVLFVFLSALLGRIAVVLAPSQEGQPACALIGAGLLALLLACLWIPALTRFRAGLGWRLRGSWPGLVVGFAVAGLLVLPANVLLGLIRQLAHESPADDPSVSLLLIPDTMLAKLTLLVLVGLIIPALEETLFRGVLFGGLRKAWRFWPAALVSGAAFALVHLHPAGIAVYLLLGIVFAALLERTRSLVAPWAAHAAFNLCGLAVMFVIFG